jgi:hypothetical protein
MSIVAIILIALLERTIRPRASILKSVALLTILPRRKTPAIIAPLTIGLVRRSVAEGLRDVLRNVWLRLKALLRLLVSVLPLRGRGETIGQRVKVAIIVHAVLVLSSRPLLTALRQSLRSVSRGNETEVVFGVLQVILGCDRISACVGVSRKLEVFFRYVMRIAAYFDVRPVRFIGSRQRIGASSIVRRPAAHPLVLTWSHFDFPTSIRLAQSFSDRLFSNLARAGRERRRVARLGRSHHIRRTDMTDHIGLNPVRNFPYTSGAPGRARTTVLKSGRFFLQQPRLPLFRYFSNPSPPLNSLRLLGAKG